MKKRIEKGSRAKNLGVNPHSKGLDFDRSSEDFIERERPAARRTKAKRKMARAEVSNHIKDI